VRKKDRKKLLLIGKGLADTLMEGWKQILYVIMNFF